MKKRQFILLMLFLCGIFACSTSNSDVITSDKDADTEEDSGKDSTEIDYSLSRASRLGQTPIVLAYTTEYFSGVIDINYVTHVNYAHGRFVNPSTGDGGIVIAKPEYLEKIVALKSQKPTLKVLLMIGGWGTKADGFSQMARDADKRLAFAKACKQAIDTYNLDGIDIDWEYPTSSSSGIASSSSDKENFTLMMRDIRQQIGITKLLTFASSSSAKYIDFAAVKKYVDYVNVMTYDMGAPPYHNSPLYSSDKTRKYSDSESIQYHIEAGMPADWLTLGIPFYGKGVSPDFGDDTGNDNDVKYNKMQDIFDSGSYTRVWDDVAKVPYLIRKDDATNTMVLTYEDAESIECKCSYIKEKKLLGAMYWEYRHDDDNGTLRKAVYNGLYGK